MLLTFYKYQGTGNDFVMIDDRHHVFDDQDLPLVNRLCNRRFGVGADGLILIREHSEYDFEMIYFNADGSQSMCGNGARCAVAFANFLGIIKAKTRFWAIDGPHTAEIIEDEVCLGMSEVNGVASENEEYFVNTGSPHHIRFVHQLDHYPVVEEGAKIRYSTKYSPHGTNVNFIEKIDDRTIKVRTYERGVEDETLSCGTGVTACALVYGMATEQNSILIKTLGGDLTVKFKAKDHNKFTEVTLKGKAIQVYKGVLTI
ncbi:diaminopimelate epimerase [Anditalea andensis]|uniref:Diaminopimelate epimerase n=1 Tax=Anditalea andensis TaxID=1048983 RepID=A0A074KWA5_9BACT|nr:diaminopimelate epimerase [Anditalea andensis]KEO73199.1 diaminopimelate epimerase [Anditalea andensis]